MKIFLILIIAFSFISCGYKQKEIKNEILNSYTEDQKCLEKCQAIIEKNKIENSEKFKEYYDYCKNIEKYFSPVILNKTKNPKEYIITEESLNNLKYNFGLMKDCITNLLSNY